MRTFAYTKYSLENLITRDDWAAYGIASAQQQADVIDRIQSRLHSNIQPYSFKVFTKNGRTMCKPDDLETAILIRKVNKDFADLTKARVTNRVETISALKSICSEGLPMTIIRLDIKKFYESVDIDKILHCASRGTKSTYALRRNLEHYINWSRSRVKGVPTGVSLSSSLAEYYLMEHLDKFANSLPGVHFYRRYVDDIIMVCSSRRPAKDYIDELKCILPEELEFNSAPEKRDIITLHVPEDHGSFNYLGYRFSIGAKINKTGHRPVNLDVAPSKIVKRKKRFVHTLLQFLKDGNEEDLRQRFLLLNSGYSFWDSSRGRKMSAGLCNTYSEIDLPSEALSSLMHFYRASMMNKKFQLYHRLRLSHLSTHTRRAIISLDLQRHVQDRKHFNFSPEALQNLSSCWKK
ncbi:antiviral reverse transcriptase Drt3a [Xinfangfangia sp. CPCC 101601]|uniref:Antiviral reverse transcriptase Drt3a n=1 Tax=Pseudogemmobacter lacusdianii TaxID=3069608 RepID=A0ABU0W112_9RHOB|nr:antiviral reverse transcriptase Drt3a [Xinfangfangia sp. CPCC 101601]MDQ2067105.1 antiviral reverse transcriptase Drt3a [Xinfangfangia sp. CPCC 101601]